MAENTANSRWPEIVQAIASSITAILFGIVVALGADELQELNESQGLRGVSEVSQLWQSDRLAEAVQVVDSLPTVTERHYRGPGRVKRSLERVTNYFETIGLLADRGYLPAEDSYHLLGAIAQQYWNRLGPAIQSMRKSRGNARLGEWFESYVEGYRRWEEQ